uniref:Uncharacterized protein n=1 Tax=Arundo donax TaxID=35708 RepID=A0A0A9C426_ARUDO
MLLKRRHEGPLSSARLSTRCALLRSWPGTESSPKMCLTSSMVSHGWSYCCPRLADSS